MKYLLLFILIITAYYYYYKHYEIPFNYHIYMGIFILLYVFLYYTSHYQPNLAYKFASNITNVHTKPLHNLIPDYSIKKTPDPIKYKLLDKQSFLCNLCKRNISIDSVPYCKLSYIQSPLSESNNNINNLQLLCPACYSKYTSII